MFTKAHEISRFNNGEGCLYKAGDDEPIFILRAQDKHMAFILRTWANRVAQEIHQPVDLHDHMQDDVKTAIVAHNDKREAQLKKVHEARQLADLVETWPNQKNPD